MAQVVLGRTPCALCGVPVQESDERFGTWGCFLPREDPLSRYCDAVMHWRCYAPWPDRPRFARAYHAMWIELESDDAYWDRAYADDAVFITANPEESVESTWVHLAETGSRIAVDFDEWAAFVTTGQIEHDLHELERETLSRARPTFAAALPTVDAVRTAADQRRAVKAL